MPSAAAARSFDGSLYLLRNSQSTTLECPWSGAPIEVSDGCGKSALG